MSLMKVVDRTGGGLTHFWSDENWDFCAEARKDEEGWLVKVAEQEVQQFATYRDATQYVMDEYRLVKSGYASWEALAADLAEELWEGASESDRAIYLMNARGMLRLLDKVVFE